MKLESVLENLNSFEKNSFLKVLDSIINSNPKNQEQVEELITNSKDLKNTDNSNIAKVYNLTTAEYINYVENEFTNVTNQLDIVIDILMRDGNCIMSYDWFSRLYEKEISSIESKVNSINKTIDKENVSENDRIRDFVIYQKCLKTAYKNDESNNQDCKVTQDELSILTTLSNALKLSQEEVKLINYTVLPIEKKPIDHIISELKNLGVIFYSRKHNTIYVADEIVKALRKVRGKVIADKFLRRILKKIKPSYLNVLCRKHNIDWKVDIDEKIETIIKEGISIKSILENEIYKEEANLTERKKFVTDLAKDELKISEIKGQTIEEKVQSIIDYYNKIENEEKVGISLDGYESLLIDLFSDPNNSKIIRKTFDLPEEIKLDGKTLLKYNIKPKDVLELLNENQIRAFCEKFNISIRGDEILNILDSYKDTENILIENYETIAYRDIKSLKDNGINIKESELGIKFEDITQNIFSELGFNVDNELRSEINTKKDKIDILIKLEDNDIIIIECKTVKEKGYNKFSTVSRQLKSYKKNASNKNYNVVKSLLVAPEFSDDFISECELEYDLNLSLVKASTLYNILNGFKNSSLKQFPHNLFMRDVLIQDERVIKAINK